MKIKIFDSVSLYSYDDATKEFGSHINEWLDDNQDIKIYKIESDIIEHKIITRIWYYE